MSPPMQSSTEHTNREVELLHRYEEHTETNQFTMSFTALPPEIRQQILLYVILAASDAECIDSLARRQKLQDTIYELSYVSTQFEADIIPVVHMLIYHYTALRELTLAIEAQTDWARKQWALVSRVKSTWANARKRRNELEEDLRMLKDCVPKADHEYV